MPEPAEAARRPTSIDDVRSVAQLLGHGCAHEALTLARDLFARGDVPRWLVADLCRFAGHAALALGAEPAAEAMWREAVGHDPTMAEAHASLARLYARQARDEDAEAACRAALAAEPQRLDALLTLGGVLARGRRVQEAEACYRTALEQAPASVAAHTDLGVLLAADARCDEAERCHRQALALDPDDAHANTNLGLLLGRRETPERRDEAETHLRRALAAAPQNAAIHSNLGNLLADLGRLEEAEDCQRRAVALEPQSAAAHCNLGALLRDRDEPAEAEACLRRALALDPQHLRARLNLGTLLLAHGRWAEGWPLHETRHDARLVGHGVAPPPYAIPPWRGEALAGKALLVWPEQGLGDQIQFARYAGLVKARSGAARVTLVCQQPLKALFETLTGVDAVHAAAIADNRFVLPGIDLSDHDCWASSLSLPRWFRTELHDVPAPIPYLHADARRRSAWAARLPAPSAGLRVGLVWRGNPAHDNDAERSLPGLETLAPLWSVPGTVFVSLQTGRAGLVGGTPPPGQPLLHIGAELLDFAETAAALAGLDQLIAVDTSIAHLAGALGVPCWLMLPAWRTDWRWLRQRGDTPWYPGTMRLFRQPRRGDWAGVVEALRAALAAL